MFQQVGHAGLAIVLVLGAHAVGHVDRGGGLAGVRRQQHLQAVGQSVLGNALDFANGLERCGKGSRQQRGSGQQGDPGFHEGSGRRWRAA
jgi:hypothetical protein